MKRFRLWLRRAWQRFIDQDCRHPLEKINDIYHRKGWKE